MPTTPASRAPRRRPVAGGDSVAPVHIGELRRFATASRPDICARMAQLAARVNSIRGKDIYQIYDLVGTVMEWQKATVLKFASTSHSDLSSRRDVDGEMRTRGEKVHRGATTLAGCSDAFCGDQI